MNQDKTFLGTEPVGKLLLKLSVPTVIAQLVNMLYNIVDRIYIGHMPEDGALALTGVGVCLPIIMIVSAFAALVSTGGAPRASIFMGKNDHESAEKTLGSCFTLQVIVSLVLTAVLLLFNRPLLLAFGASENTIDYAVSYMSVYAIGTIFVQLTLGMNAFITAQGFAKTGMYSVIIGAVLNIVLDPVFIFALHMGVAGAAVATVLSQMASCAFVLSFLFGKKVPVKISFGGYDRKLIQRILLVGFTPFIIIAVDNVMIISMNSVLQTYGGPGEGDMLITCATIVQSFMLVITMPLGGITGGTQTILAFNYGAGQPDRVKKAQRFIFLLSAGYTTILFILAQTAGHIFVRLFTSDPALIAEAAKTIKIYTLAVIPLSIQYVIVDGFTGLGKVQLSLPLSFFRKLVYFLPLFLLPRFFGARATFYAEPISDIIAPVVSIFIYAVAMKRILKKPVIPNF